MAEKREFRSLMHPVVKIIAQNPIIFAVKNDYDLQRAIASQTQVLFFLYGNICTIDKMVAKAKNAGKTVVVHIDFIDGLASREIAVDWIRENTLADGIISTKPKLLRRAKERGLFTILRFFLLDSKAIESAMQNIEQASPDMVEILPGIATEYFHTVAENYNLPVIAGGLISDRKRVLAAFKAGATAISSSNLELGRLMELLHDNDD